MGYRRSVSFVVAQNHRAANLEIAVTEATTGMCGACGHALDTYGEAKRQGREFMEMIMERAHGGFWDGLREVLRERGAMQ